MRAEDLQTATIPGAFIWPNIDGQEELFRWFRKKDAHILAVVLGEPSIFLANLFGTYDAFLPLGPLEESTIPRRSHDGRVLQIELPSRRLRDCSLDEYLAALVRAMRERVTDASGQTTSY
jgi:hypothetical protein